MPPYHFRDILCIVGRIAGVDTFRREPEIEVFSAFQACRFEYWFYKLLCGAWISGRLKNHHHPFAEILRNRFNR